MRAFVILLTFAAVALGAPQSTDLYGAVGKRDGTCATAAANDTAESFECNPALIAMADDAPTPYGYQNVFTGLNASVSASDYMGLYTLESYDTVSCQQYCDQAAGCAAFNVYAERDPTVNPDPVNCPNPPSETNFECTLWGTAISAADATNFGQWRASFQVVIAASNGYVKNPPPASIPDFEGPTELAGAINAPLDAEGYNTYLGLSYYPITPDQCYAVTCASDCLAHNQYVQTYDSDSWTYELCRFFNVYVLSMNGVAQGMYCTMYNETWASSYATNYGDYDGSDRYTVSDSYSYSLADDPSSSNSSTASSASSSSVAASPTS